METRSSKQASNSLQLSNGKRRHLQENDEDHIGQLPTWSNTSSTPPVTKRVKFAEQIGGASGPKGIEEQLESKRQQAVDCMKYLMEELEATKKIENDLVVKHALVRDHYHDIQEDQAKLNALSKEIDAKTYSVVLAKIMWDVDDFKKNCGEWFKDELRDELILTAARLKSRTTRGTIN